MKRLWKFINNYLVFFLTTAFLVTCSILLFTNALIDSLGVVLTSENLQTAAKLTFINVLALSLIYTVADAVRRKCTVARAAKRIADAASKIASGDFSVRVPQVKRFTMDESFFTIIDCFNKMAGELSGVETLRTDFISSVSHEMKTPLAVIGNYGTLLQTPEISDEQRYDYARGIMDASRRLSDMVTNILKLNKLENQQIFPNSEKYDLGQQLIEALLQYENVWEQENIEIETDIAEDVTVHADRELLALVWNNLLSNAFKFTPPGGTVRLSMSADEKYAYVLVQDTGCGMSKETGVHIFEKFYQGDTSHATRGNGLGLSLVKRVMDIMHGEISVKSVLGEGSTFTVKIRRAE